MRLTIMHKFILPVILAYGLAAQVKDTAPRVLASVTFTNLGTPANGTLLYCSDCTTATTCSGSGSGALAKRENGAWVCGASGTGTVTSVDAAEGVETAGGSAITATGTVRAVALINAQTGTSYTIVTGDRGKMLTLSNAAAVAVTLPQSGSGGFPSGWFLRGVRNANAGTVTITPTTSTINAAASLKLYKGWAAFVSGDGTNYQALVSGAKEVQASTLGATVGSGTTSFTGIGVGAGTTETTFHWRVDAPGAIANIAVYISTSQPGSCDLTMSIRKNAADTGGETLTITGGSGAGWYTSTEATAPVYFAVGDTAAIKIVNGTCTSATFRRLQWQWIPEL